MLPTKFQFIWPSGYRGEDVFRNQPIRNNNCLWWSCVLTDRDEISNLYRKPSIDASYQVSVHLARWAKNSLCFSSDTRWATLVKNPVISLERRKDRIVIRTNTACVAHLSFCFKQTLYRTFHRYFLPNFVSFCQAVSEEKNFF
jgi:hypothetical protein